MTATMQAIVFHGAGKWGLEAVAQPVIAANDEVLLKVERAGICGTDLHILSTPPGHPATTGSILGHEYVATIVDAGDGVTHLQRGDRVVIDPNMTCGLCQYCRLGMTNVCERMTTLGIFRHGGLAEFNVAPAKSLHRISNDVPLERAALAEPLACVWHAFEKAALVPGESVAILGAGPIGLLFLLLFKAAGAGKVYLIEPADFRRQQAEDLGADGALNPKTQNIASDIRTATGLGADLVVDTVGSLLPEALELVRFGGRVLLFGLNSHAERTIHQYYPTRYEVTIIGSFIQRTAFPKVVRVLEAGLMPVEKLITHRIGLSELKEGLEALRHGTAIKVLAQP
jgi:(R,R)-butanediol dehydrogenase / meso-butanediol dehydrogenase / diacetyl reductase